MIHFIKKTALFFCFLLTGQFLFAATPVASVSSPDNQLAVLVSVEGGKPLYSVRYKGKEVLENSPLGMITNVGDFSSGMKLLTHRTSAIDESYTLNRTKKSRIHYRANELVCTFENAKKQAIDIQFRVSANDIAFRYALPEYGETACCVIEKETTGFHFPVHTTTFLSPQATPMSFWKRTKPSYEEKYRADEPVGTPSQYGLGYTFPGLFHAGAHWILVSETGVNGSYCASRLSEGTKEGIYTIAFPDARENNGIGSAHPAIALPGFTPWRTITVGDNLKPVVETTVPFDVVKPFYEPSMDYQFGRSTWSWIMWQDESINFEDQVKYIDFTAFLGFEYILIDASWDTQIGYERMPELIRYARSKGVDVFLWYNSNGYWNDAPYGPKNKMNTSIARKKEMQWLKSLGVKGVKVDFFGGDKQQTMQLYEDILSDANEYGLMVIFHGATIPRGWERMYPNYVGSEAVLASENLIFTQEACDNEACNACLHPFIRNAIGSMEFGPVLLNKRHNRTNDGGSVRKTSDIFQIATAVLFQNPVQVFALAPNNKVDAPWLAIDFMSEVPTTWDETVFLDGYPGKYCILARRHGEKWYIAGVNAEKEIRKIKLRLPMLEGQHFVLYYDDENRRAHSKSGSLKKGEEITLEIRPEGGIVLATPRAALWKSPSGEFLQQAQGEDFASKDLITYRVPPEYPQEGTSPFTIAVNNKYTGIYTDFNGWKNLVCFSYFDFDPGKEAEVKLTVAMPFTNYKILPESKSIVSTREGQTIRFKMKEANTNLSFVFDDNYTGAVLHLFANAIDREAPVKSNDNLIYFGKGYHDLEKMYGGTLKISGNKKVYIAGGAVVNGKIRIEQGDGNEISGHGVLMHDIPGGLVLSLARSTNVNLNGIIACSHRNPGWTVALSECSDVRVKNFKIVSPRFASTDGFDIVNSNHIYLSDSFVRTCDDAITLKGLAKGNPADCPPNENLYFERLQLWSDCNSAMCVGEESRAKHYNHIHFKDIDVIFSYDDRYHPTLLDERSVMSIVSLEGTYFRNITWENIRVNRCERLICLTFKDDFWFESVRGNQSTEGGIENVTFKNIRVSSNSGSSIANEILLNGWYREGTPTKIIQNITFENVFIEGKQVVSEQDPHIKTNNSQGKILVKNLVFK